MSRAWAKGSTRRWRRVRQQVLQRDSWECQLRLPDCTHVASHAHHVAGRGAGDDPANLIAACAHCNTSLGDPTRTDPAPTRRTRW